MPWKKILACFRFSTSKICKDRVEIVTHIGPHRRIWMGPQFVFKPSSKCSGTGDTLDTTFSMHYAAQSHPVNMPVNNCKSKNMPVVPIFIESGSNSSLEQPPYLLEVFGGIDSDSSAGIGESKIQEDLADAMIESPTSAVHSPPEIISDTEIAEVCQEKLTLRKPRKTKKKRK